MVRNLVLTALGAAGLLTATAASAQQITTFDFRPNANESWQTSRSFTKNGITVTATAWYSSTPAASPFQSVRTAGDTDTGVGAWSTGLGASNPNENGSSNDHTIDNIGSYDFLLLTFSQPVQILTGLITAYNVNGTNGVTDADAHVSFTYNPALNPITNSSVWANLQLHGTEVSADPAGNGSTLTMNFNPGMNTGNQWLIGASQLLDKAGAAKDRDDGFKLATLSVQLPVPEPTTWAMMMMGVGVTGASLRRRPRGASKLARA